MAHDERQDPLERLRAADPAAGVEPRDGFADEVIARATADAPVEAAPVADLATERARRRPRWLPVAAVAASLVVVGGAGANTIALPPEAQRIEILSDLVKLQQRLTALITKQAARVR